MQIIVLGAHRSGTSMVTRLINMMGAYFGMGESSIGANIENPKGFWERSDVIAVNDEILQHYGCAWDKLQGWKFYDKAPEKELKALQPVMERMKNILLEMDANRPWVMKDPRMCVTYPFWKTQLEVPVIVCVYRNPQEVARSLKKRNEFAFSHSMALWEYYATGIANAIRQTPTIYVSHSELLSDPVATVKRMFEELQKLEVRGLSMPTEREITSFVDPGLYRSKGDEDALSDMLTEYQKRLIAHVSGREAAPSVLLQPTELAEDLVDALAQYRTLQGKMEDQNQRFSDVLQQNNEMENRLEFMQRELVALREKYEFAVNKERVDIELLKQSASWKLGHGIVKFMRTVTFRKSNNAY